MGVLRILAAISFFYGFIETSYLVVWFEVKDGACINRGSTAQMNRLGVFNIVCFYPIPLMIFAFCYGRMIFTLRKSKSAKVKSANQKGDKKEAASVKLMWMMMTVSVVYIIVNGPNMVIFFMHNLQVYKLDFNGDFYHASVALVYMNQIVNPFVYCIANQKFREAIIHTFSPCFRRSM